MDNATNLIIVQEDFQRLSSLAEKYRTEAASLLEQELDRAVIVTSENLPADVVTMNSEVGFVDLDSGKESAITLVYPHEANIGENKISILAPVGVALIGLRVDQTIHWPLPNGKERRLKVTGVVKRT